MPKIMVGLGNHGDQYHLTRHNAGFWFLDAVAKQQRATFSYQRKFKADSATISIFPADNHSSAKNITLLKPQTFINNSGMAVSAALTFYSIQPADLLIIHDDIDLPVGTVKLKYGGGTAGHNGLADIGRHLSTNDYWRLRIGIGKPEREKVADYVLHPPSVDERQHIGEAINRIFGVWDKLATDDYEGAMLVLHSNNPPSPQ